MTALTRNRFECGRAPFGLACAGIVVSALAWRLDAPQFFPSWLSSWLFFLGIALGSMVNVMIHELTGGDWGFAIRRPLEAAIGTVPVLAAMAVPLAFGLTQLFPWARNDAAGQHILGAKLWYLNPTAFELRAIVYFALWISIGAALRRHWGIRETNARSAPAPALRRLSIIGILIYAVTMTLAAVDWIMSLSADWYSTTFGLVVMVGQALCAFAFAVACAFFTGGSRVAASQEARNSQDLGNILLMFVMTWAYLAFTQYLIIWAEDLPSEIGWYLVREQPVWKWLAVVVLVAQFALPFLAMLFRPLKRNPLRLAAICIVVLAAHWLETFWMVAPGFRQQTFWLQWTDLIVFLSAGAIWTAAFLRISYGTRPRTMDDRTEAAGHG